MKEEIWNKLYLYLIRIEIGVFKIFKECARSPCNGNNFSSILEKLFPLQGERGHSSYFRCFQKQNREEGETE